VVVEKAYADLCLHVKNINQKKRKKREFIL
jgi:hypothetical protein